MNLKEVLDANVFLIAFRNVEYSTSNTLFDDDFYNLENFPTSFFWHMYNLSKL